MFDIKDEDFEKLDVPREPVASEDLVDWENPPSLDDLKKDYTEAKNEHDTHVTNVDYWLDNLNITGSAKLTPKTGRSSVQPKLIRKQAEWRYAALSEPFMSTPDVFNAKPISANDKKSAEQNGLVLNNQFNTKINKTKFIDEYIRTAVDEGSVVVRVGWEVETEITNREVPAYEYRKDMTVEATQLNQMTAQMYMNNRKEYDKLPEAYKECLRITDRTGFPHIPIKTGSTSEEVEEITKNQPTVEVCDYQNIIIDPTCKGELDDAEFIIYSFSTSKSDLLKRGGYKNIDDIDVKGNTAVTDVENESRSSFEFADEPRQQFIAYEYWGYWDINGDGVAQPIVATWVGNTLIQLRHNPYPDGKLPFVLVQYLPVRKEVYGEPDGELLIENQKIVGAVTRGMVDIMARGANGQKLYRKDAFDITNKKKFMAGEDAEYNAHIQPERAFHMNKFPEIPQSAGIMLQLQNDDAESLTGVKAFSSGVSGNALGDSATGIRSALDATSKRELGILRRLADGVVKIGRKITGMNAINLSEEEVVRITDEDFVIIKKDDLNGAFDLELTISTAEADEAKASELAFMLQTVGPNTEPEFTRLILTDIAKLRKMPALAKRIEEYAPQPDPMAERERIANIMLIEAQVAEKQAQTQLTMAKARAEGSKADQSDLDYVEQESGVKQEREKELHGAQADANMELEVVKSALAPKKETATKQ